MRAEDHVLLLGQSEIGRLLDLETCIDEVEDSAAITTLRTGAATAVAARHLARPASRVANIVGCGAQGGVQLAALCRVLPLGRALAFDRDGCRADRFADDWPGSLAVARRKPGRAADHEITLFDSTGVAIQDVATAAIAYQRALASAVGQTVVLAS